MFWVVSELRRASTNSPQTPWLTADCRWDSRVTPPAIVNTRAESIYNASWRGTDIRRWWLAARGGRRNPHISVWCMAWPDMKYRSNNVSEKGALLVSCQLSIDLGFSCCLLDFFSFCFVEGGGGWRHRDEIFLPFGARWDYALLPFLLLPVFVVFLALWRADAAEWIKNSILAHVSSCVATLPLFFCSTVSLWHTQTCEQQGRWKSACACLRSLDKTCSHISACLHQGALGY